MKPSFRNQVSLMGFLRGFEVSEIEGFPIHANTCSKESAMSGYSKKSAFVVFLCLLFVFAIDGVSSGTKIFNAVVDFVSIDVVNDSRSPFSMEHGPSDSMNLVELPKDSDIQVSVMGKASNQTASLYSPPSTDILFPKELTIRVGKKVMQFFGFHGSDDTSVVTTW